MDKFVTSISTIENMGGNITINSSKSVRVKLYNKKIIIKIFIIMFNSKRNCGAQ